MTVSSTEPTGVVYYEITGSAAHSRIKPLLPSHWVDVTHTKSRSPQFLWENAPRSETRPYRDQVTCYSHLPNGTAILDSKWVLGRLLTGNEVGALPTHCLLGSELENWWESEVKKIVKNDNIKQDTSVIQSFVDLDNNGQSDSNTSNDNALNIDSNNLWVLKDASSNGAGGVWVVGLDNYKNYLPDSGTIHATHKYVLQKYAWPPVLYKGKKCHVRVYGLLTGQGECYVHRRAFLHVANDDFCSQNSDYDEYSDQVHITNCCANSHDEQKFMGEICADLLLPQGTHQHSVNDDSYVAPMVGLGEYWQSIQSTVSVWASKVWPFVQGGQENGGMEYLGFDFILSSRYSSEAGCNENVAYLLEINAPPSQDTATGLPHAEETHDTVLGDLINKFVVPKVETVQISNPVEDENGWQRVFESTLNDTMPIKITPSKAAMLNKLKWRIYERKLVQEQTKEENNVVNSIPLDLPDKVRSEYALWRHSTASQDALIFWENAGGTQVPISVKKQMIDSLDFRHRSLTGKRLHQLARQTLARHVGCNDNTSQVYIGANASSLLHNLASLFASIWSTIDRNDTDTNVVIDARNHTANILPWLNLAKRFGWQVRWWMPDWKVLPMSTNNREVFSTNLRTILSDRTVLVALPHASNVLGEVYDILSHSKLIRAIAPQAHIVVDGVAAVPHVYANFDELDIDWYVVSCHKMFGPHLGALCCNGGTITKLKINTEEARSMLEIGTTNAEACAGVVGLGEYFKFLAKSLDGSSSQTNEPVDTGDDCNKLNSGFTYSTMLAKTEIITSLEVKLAYKLIASMEKSLAHMLIGKLKQISLVTIIEFEEGLRNDSSMIKAPLVSWYHERISCETIVDVCQKHGIATRSGTYLSHKYLQDEVGITDRLEQTKDNGVVRFSLVHYNTVSEISKVFEVLESIPGW